MFYKLIMIFRGNVGEKLRK